MLYSVNYTEIPRDNLILYLKAYVLLKRRNLILNLWSKENQFENHWFLRFEEKTSPDMRPQSAVIVPSPYEEENA